MSNETPVFDFRLRVFDAVARRLSFTRAAEELYITQPAVTRHIQELEQHFKVRLFDREGSRIRLTAGGKLFLQYTTQVLSIYHALENDMAALSEQHRGRLRIGASTTIAQYLIPPILAGFHERFEEVRVGLVSGNTEQIEKALLHQEIDLGLIEGQKKNKDIHYLPFADDELVLIAHRRHDAARKTITPAELLKIPLLLREPGSGTLEVIAHALKGIGIKLAQLRVDMQLDSTESIKAYVQHSHCMAFVSRHAVRQELEAKEYQIISIKGLHIRRPLYFIQLESQASGLSRAFQRFALQYNIK